LVAESLESGAKPMISPRADAIIGVVRPSSENALSLRRNLVHALDRSAGRAILGFLATRWARRTLPGVLIEYRQGVWGHRLGGYAFADSLRFDYYAYTIKRWPGNLENILSQAEDHWFFADRPAAGSVIVDVGAGKGEDCVAFSRAVGPNGKVLAVEAHPATFQCLRASIELNGLSNVVPIHCAVTEKPGSVLIETAEDWESSCVVSDVKGGDRVPGVPLDGLVRQHNLTRIDFLKMNIEGAEALAIEGMTQSFPIIRALCISCHDFRANRGDGEFFRTKAFVERRLQAVGFRIVPRQDPRDYIADQVNAISTESTVQ
jgi:FkbM family methyltransferase